MIAPGFRVRDFDGIELLQADALREEGLIHGFTLRTGGFGARGRGDADREALARALGISRLATMRQVHGSDVRNLAGNDTPSCDGLGTDRKDVGLVVQSADCVPLLFRTAIAGPVAAVHAGWRGTLARIASRAVSCLQDGFGAKVEDLVVVVGPAIRVCCYEVGDEVIAAFAGSGRDVDRISRPGPRGRRHLDLVEENRLQLEDSGVPPERILDSLVCTRCENDRFYSYRGEGEGVGRIFGVVGLL